MARKPPGGGKKHETASPLQIRRQPTPPTFSSWAPSLQNCETINFCHLSHPGQGILLRQ